MHSSLLDDIDRQLRSSTDPRRVQSLKSYRNSLVPVSRLPHILLTDIFILLIHHSELRVHTTNHVCRAWRYSALQCPLFTAPLTVNVPIKDLNLADQAFVTSVRLALSHIRHIRYLCINLLDRFRDLGDLLSPFLSGSPDILEVLILSSLSVFPNYVYPSMENAPCLRSLELYSCHINWQKFSSVANLTSLVLQDIPMASRPSIENVLSLLQTMTKLEKLALIHAIAELPSSLRTLPPTDIAPLKLEHLFYLSLTGFVLDCANVMRHFIMPHCRLVTLKAVTRWHIPEVTLAVPPLASVISSSFSQLERQESPYFASIDRLYDNAIAITARPVVDAGEFSLFLSLIWQPSSPPNIAEIPPGFENLLSELPLGRIVQFSASRKTREDHTGDVEWLEIVPRLSRVETVVLSGGYTYGFANAFCDARATNVTIVLPNLTSLTINHAHFSFPLGDAELFSTLKQRTVPVIALQLAILNTLSSGPVDCTGEPETWGVGESDQDPSDEDSPSNSDEN
ncbi:hypothetical protein BC826DRAFT_1041713 [Russula brevipes]|nr:hypothetical protein BC826DRAFT_1041713 [Russula brevipes]